MRKPRLGSQGRSGGSGPTGECFSSGHSGGAVFAGAAVWVTAGGVFGGSRHGAGSVFGAAGARVPGERSGSAGMGAQWYRTQRAGLRPERAAWCGRRPRRGNAPRSVGDRLSLFTGQRAPSVTCSFLFQQPPSFFQPATDAGCRTRRPGGGARTPRRLSPVCLPVASASAVFTVQSDWLIHLEVSSRSRSVLS